MFYAQYRQTEGWVQWLRSILSLFLFQLKYAVSKMNRVACKWFTRDRSTDNKTITSDRQTDKQTVRVQIRTHLGVTVQRCTTHHYTTTHRHGWGAIPVRHASAAEQDHSVRHKLNNVSQCGGNTAETSWHQYDIDLHRLPAGGQTPKWITHRQHVHRRWSWYF